MILFITKGDAPLTDAQLHWRTQRMIALDWPAWKRERGLRKNDDAYKAFFQSVESDTDANRVNNVFNRRLAAFLNATGRLARYVLADGRAEVWEDQPTGAFDEDGEPVMESVLVQSSVDPLIPQVDGWDHTDPENPVPAQVPNPLIKTDEAERDAAQAVVDATPAEVKDF
jgi:hypothetical protein